MKILAAFVLVTATNSFSSIFPEACEGRRPAEGKGRLADVMGYPKFRKASSHDLTMAITQYKWVGTNAHPDRGTNDSDQVV